MFDVGFQEIILIAVVAIFVLGPEKMPGAVRTIALTIGRLKRNFNALKTEIEKEIGADEIRRTLRNEEIMEKFKNTQAQVQNSISAVKKDVDTFQKNIESQVVSSATPEAVPATTTSAEDSAGLATIAAPESNVAEPNVVAATTSNSENGAST